MVKAKCQSKNAFRPNRDLRTVEGYMNAILKHPMSEDFVFVRLIDDTPMLSPMEQIRTVYPNAMHVERKSFRTSVIARR